MKVKTYNLEMHYDKRGWLAEILRVDKIKENIAQIYVSFSEQNMVRGGHYHKHKTEWFFVVKGEAEIYLKELETGEDSKMLLSGNDNLLIEIPPLVFHRIQSITELYLIAISSEVFNKDDPDTFVD